MFKVFKFRNKMWEEIEDSSKTLLPTQMAPVNRFSDFGGELPKNLLQSQLNTILVRSNVGNLEPSHTIDEVDFTTTLSAALRNLKTRNLRPVQRYSFEAIMKGHNTVLVSEPKTGKTFGYVLPIMNALAKFAEENTNNEPGQGPLAIILCSNSSTCISIESLCQTYANFGSKLGAKKTRIITTYGGGAEKEKKVALRAGCELLISTDHCLERMLLCCNGDRLKWIVLDQFDELSSNDFFQTFRRSCDTSVQVIVAAENLTERLWQFMKYDLQEYTLVVGSHSEAAVYAQLRQRVIRTSETKKVSKLSKAVAEILNEAAYQRIIVVCGMKVEVTMLYDALKIYGVDPLAIHSGMNSVDAQRIIGIWGNIAHPVLVCDDDSIESDLVPIHDATFLLHYSMPIKSKNAFGLRFSTLLDNYRNHFTDFMEISPNAKVVVLLDEDTETQQLRTLVDFQKRCGVPVADSIVEKCEENELSLEWAKLAKPLCQSLLSRGTCSSQRICEYRHLFVANDQKRIPWCGELTFTINTVNNTTCWGVKPISIIDFDGNREMIPNQLEELKEKLDNFFAVKQNWRPIGQCASVGDLCAVQDRNGVFYRGRIELILQLDKFEKPTKVKIFTIDNGDLLDQFEVCELFELPQELAVYPPQAVLLYIHGILPVDFDTDWSPAAHERAVIARNREIKENEEWKAQIILDITDILIVKNPVLVCHFFDKGITKSMFNFVSDMVVQGLAVKDNRFITAVYENLCFNRGITLSSAGGPDGFNRMLSVEVFPSFEVGVGQWVTKRDLRPGLVTPP